MHVYFTPCGWKHGNAQTDTNVLEVFGCSDWCLDTSQLVPQLPRSENPYKSIKTLTNALISFPGAEKPQQIICFLTKCMKSARIPINTNPD